MSFRARLCKSLISRSLARVKRCWFTGTKRSARHDFAYLFQHKKEWEREGEGIKKRKIPRKRGVGKGEAAGVGEIRSFRAYFPLFELNAARESRNDLRSAAADASPHRKTQERKRKRKRGRGHAMLIINARGTLSRVGLRKISGFSFARRCIFQKCSGVLIKIIRS